MTITAINLSQPTQPSQPATQANPAFKAKEKTEKKEKVYQRTDAFKIMGASTFGGLGIAATVTAFIMNKKLLLNDGAKIPNKFLILGGLAATVGGAILGALGGVMKDYTINKTVENTVLSLKNNKE